MTKKRRFLPKYVSAFQDRHGKERLRFRRGTYSHYIEAELGTEAFRTEYKACLDAEQPAPATIADQRVVPGTYDDLIQRYYRSAKWKSRTDKAQNHDRRILARFQTEHGKRTITGTTYERAERIIGAKSATPEAARKLLKILRRLHDYAVAIGLRQDNPFALVVLAPSKSKGYHEWTEEEIAQYQAHHPLGTKARLAMELMLWTGQRRSDACRLGRQKVREGRIKIVQEKTGAELWVPLAPQLVQAITAMPAHTHMTYLVTEYGLPFSVDGFGNKFREWCRDAGLPQCTPHGLRKAIARRLGDLGMSNLSLKAVGGWKTDAEVARYTKGFDQRGLADAAIAALSRWELSNRDEGLDNARG